MNYGRWYPSLLTLGSGRLLAVSGYEVQPQVSQPEIYNRLTGTWTKLDYRPLNTDEENLKKTMQNLEVVDGIMTSSCLTYQGDIDHEFGDQNKRQAVP